MYKLSISLLPTACIISKRNANESRRPADLVRDPPYPLVRSYGPMQVPRSNKVEEEACYGECVPDGLANGVVVKVL